MCKFSESNRQKLGNAVNYIAAHARYPYKTEVLKLLFLMEDVMKQYGWMNSDQLIAETHKEGSLWHETAKENDLLEDFEMKKASTSNVIIDMARGLSDADREFYEDTLNIRESANLMRLDRELGRA